MAISTLTSPVIHILVPDTRFTPSAISSTDPAAGILAAETNFGMETLPDSGNVADPNGLEGGRPVGGGTPTASATITVDVLKPGRPDASSTWTYVQTSATYGATGPHIPMGAETVVGVTSGDGYRYPTGLAHSDGSRVVVAERTLGTDGVVAFRRAAGASAWAAAATATIWTQTTAFTATVRPSPVLVQIPSDTSFGVIDQMWSLDLTATSTLTLRLDYSTDGGNNWSFGGYSNLTFDVSVNYRNLLGICYDELSQNLFIATYLSGANTLHIWRSVDLGATWSSVSGMAVSNVLAAKLQARCGMVYLVTVSTGGDVTSYRASGISTSWTTTETTIGGAAYSAVLSHLGYVVVPSGMQYLYVRRAASTEHVQMFASSDDGETWGAVASAAGVDDYPYDDDTGNRAWDDGTAPLTDGVNINDAIYNGGSVWLLGSLTSAATVDNSIVAVKLGEYSNFELIKSGGTGATISDLFYPANTLDAKTSFTFATSGATTETLALDAAGHLVDRLSTDNSTGILTDAQSGIVFTAHWILGASSSGGSTASDAIALEVRADDAAGTANCTGQVRVNATTRQLQLYDVNGAVNRGSAATYTAGAPVEILLSVKRVAGGGVMTAAWRMHGGVTWTVLASNQTAVETVVAAAARIRVGKLSASIAQVDTLYLRYSSDDLAAGTQPTRKGLPAMSAMDRIPSAAFSLRWDGSPLLVGNQWTVRTRSDTPLSYTSALSIAPSPLRQWIGPTGAAAATHSIVYDFGATYRGRISRELFGLAVAELDAVETIAVDRWDGAAWVELASGSMRYEAFTLLGTSFDRDSAASYTLYPGANANASPRYWSADELKGFWCVVGDGVDTAAGTILGNGDGYFTAGTPTPLRAWIELDPATVVTVAGGGWAAVAISTVAGVLKIYARDAILVARQLVEATRYYRIRVVLGEGATIPAAGVLWLGRVLTMGRPYRAGASISVLTDPRLRRPARQIELPYDQILVPNGTYQLDGATVANATSFNGSTPRAMVENPVPMLEALVSQVGRQRGRRRGIPVGLVLDGDWLADPSSSAQIYLGKSAAFGYLGNSLSITAGRGFLRPVQEADSEHGAALVLDEPALYLPTV